MLQKRKTVTFVDRPVHVCFHKTLNSSKGVIRCHALSDLSEVEIRDEPKTQGVVEVHRVTVKKEGKSRSVYSHTCYAYFQGFLPCLFLPSRSIHLHFVQNLSRFLLCWLLLTHGSCVGPQNKIGHPAGCRFCFERSQSINRLKNHDLWYVDV